MVAWIFRPMLMALLPGSRIVRPAKNLWKNPRRGQEGLAAQISPSFIFPSSEIMF